MLNENTNIKTKTYTYTRTFNIDITETDELFEAWICEERVGMKSYMFGISKENHTFEEMVDLVEGNIDEHIRLYLDELDELEEMRCRCD